MRKQLFIFISAALFLISAQAADATILYALPEKTAVMPGEFLNVDIKINTEDVSINAIQATVQFPSNVLELIEADNTVSAFNFWVEDPLISNEEGTLKFIGGTTQGVSGQALQVLKMTFKAVGAGQAPISFSDSVVTANDGKGTNVLSKIEGTNIAVSPEVVNPVVPVVPISPTAPSVPAEQPAPVLREPVQAEGRPDMPQLRVPLYPDESRWYSHLGEVIAFWDVPADVTKVAAAIDKNPTTSPENIESGLFTGKSFGVLQEGVWYVHVQFRNNVGWGPEAHYKISIDTTPPVSFKVDIDQEASDNPSPKISYESFDSLSGIAKALVFVDDKGLLESQETSLTLPLQAPGKHTLRVRILDNAGNSVEDSLEFEILPLQTPVIEFITKRVSREEPVFVSGTGLANSFIDLLVYDKSNQEIYKETVGTDASGKWGVSLKEPLLLGNYIITATTRDDRGALSFPSPAEKFTVRPQTIVSLGPLDLSWFGIFIIIALIALAGFGFYGWYYIGLKKKRGAYAVIVARDIEKMHDLLMANLTKLESNMKNLEKFYNPVSKTIDPSLKEESLSSIKKMWDVLDKIKKYVKKEVEDLK